MQQMAASDPTAQALVQTQMAETKRKTDEAVAKLQLEREKMQMEMQDKIRDMQAAVQELQAKLGLEEQLKSQDNAVKVAMADLNNSSRERIAEISAKQQLTATEMQQQHAQNQTALEAETQAYADLRAHGIQQAQAEQQQAHEATMQAQQALAQQQQQPTGAQNGNSSEQ